MSNFFLVATTGQGNSKSADKWIPAIVILTSGLALFLILFTTYHFLSKKFGTGYRACKRKMTSNHLSSKGNLQKGLCHEDTWLRSLLNVSQNAKKKIPLKFYQGALTITFFGDF